MSGADPISAISEITNRRAAADLIIDARSGDRWTYAQATELALKLAAALRASGVSHGDRVMILIENSPAVVLAYFAALHLGAVIVPVNRSSSASDIEYARAVTGVKLTLVSRATAALAAGPALCLTIERGDVLLDGRSVSEQAQLTPFEGVRSTDLFSITLTSGSTAQPKGVIHSIGTLFGNARSFNTFTSVGEDTRFLHGLPMSYMAGLLNSIICPFMAGGTIVIGEEFSARTCLDFWSVPRRFAVNTLWATPTLIAMLLELDRSSDGVEHCRETGMRIFVGTAPLSADHRSRFEARYGVPLRTSYGLSELLLLTVRRPDSAEDPDSNGAPLPDVEIRVEGADGDDGEISVRTPYASPGYLGAEDGAPEWFATGDLGRILVHGELRITGRKKDLIITGGVNVSPAAVEHVIRAHPAVRDAVAVGVPDPILGEAVAVVVEVDPTVDASRVRDELLSSYVARLGAAQRPRHIVISEQLPRSSTGKVRRAEVRANVIAEVTGS